MLKKKKRKRNLELGTGRRPEAMARGHDRLRAFPLIQLFSNKVFTRWRRIIRWIELLKKKKLPTRNSTHRMPINQAVWRFSFVSLSLSLSLCHRRRHHSRSNENQLTHPTPGGTNDAVDLASINTRRWLHWRYKTRWKTIRYCFVCFFLVINWSFCWRRSASPVGSVWRRRPRSLPCTSWSPSKAIRNETIQVNCHWFFHCVQSERLIFIEKKRLTACRLSAAGHGRQLHVSTS